MSPPLLQIRGLSRRFPGVAALKGVDLDACSGEIHALVGANGAGKSTLINLLAGVIQPSAGEIRMAGEPVQFSSPAAAQAHGIATVYQELSLVPQLSVARNIYLGREPHRRFGVVNQPLLLKQARELLDRFNLQLDPQAQVEQLSVAEQQLVEVARALSFSARVLILDEPTAVLSIREQNNLFDIIRHLRSQGLLVLYVSHHLNEVLALADRVTIVRDGEKVATREVPGLTLDDLVGLMIGRSGAWSPAAPTERGSARAFHMTYSSDTGTSHISAGHGEIVGIAGLVGAGRTTFAKALAGNPRVTARVQLADEGRPPLASPQVAMRAGIVYLTEDRKRDGIFGNLSTLANAVAAAMPGMARGPLRAPLRERSIASTLLSRLKVAAHGIEQPITKLSGGNQQKVIIARALLTNPKLLICDEPTRGVDVGSKAEIHELLRELARTGVAVIVISSEIEELIAVSNRIVVMRDRRFVTEFTTEEMDEGNILLAASGSTSTRREAAAP